MKKDDVLNAWALGKSAPKTNSELVEMVDDLIRYYPEHSIAKKDDAREFVMSMPVPVFMSIFGNGKPLARNVGIRGKTKMKTPESAPSAAAAGTPSGDTAEDNPKPSVSDDGDINEKPGVSDGGKRSGETVYRIGGARMTLGEIRESYPVIVYWIENKDYFARDIAELSGIVSEGTALRLRKALGCKTKGRKSDELFTVHYASVADAVRNCGLVDEICKNTGTSKTVVAKVRKALRTLSDEESRFGYPLLSKADVDMKGTRAVPGEAEPSAGTAAGPGCGTEANPEPVPAEDPVPAKDTALVKDTAPKKRKYTQRHVRKINSPSGKVYVSKNDDAKFLELEFTDEKLLIKNPPKRAAAWRFLNIVSSPEKFRCSAIGDVVYRVYIDGEKSYYYMFNNPDELDRMSLVNTYHRLFEYGAYRLNDVHVEIFSKCEYEKKPNVYKQNK